MGMNSLFMRATVFCKPTDEDDLFGDNTPDDDDDSSGGSVFDDDGDGAGAGDVGDDKPVAPAFDTAALTNAIVDGLRQAQPQQPEPPKQLSAQELAERMGVWDPTDDEANELASIMSDPELTGAQKKKAFTQLRDKIVKQAVQTASLQFANEFEQLRQQVAPAMGVAAEQRKRAAEQSLYSEFPGLKVHKSVVDMVAQQKAAEYRAGTLVADPKLTANEFIARETFRVLKSVNPNISKDVVKRQPKGSAPKPAAISTTGKAGGTSGSTKSKGSIWG